MLIILYILYQPTKIIKIIATFAHMGDNKNKFWDEAGKGGLILAGVAIAYFLIVTMVGKAGNAGFAVKLLNFLLWAGKFALCIWLMVRLLRAEATRNGADRSRTFRLGMAVAFLSALVYAGFYMFYVSIIDPEYFKETFDSFAVAFSSQLPSDQMDAFMNMESLYFSANWSRGISLM